MNHLCLLPRVQLLRFPKKVLSILPLLLLGRYIKHKDLHKGLPYVLEVVTPRHQGSPYETVTPRCS